MRALRASRERCRRSAEKSSTEAEPVKQRQPGLRARTPSRSSERSRRSARSPLRFRGISSRPNSFADQTLVCRVSPLLGRFAPRAGFVTLRQTFVRRCQNCGAWTALTTRRARWARHFGRLGNRLKVTVMPGCGPSVDAITAALTAAFAPAGRAPTGHPLAVHPTHWQLHHVETLPSKRAWARRAASNR